MVEQRTLDDGGQDPELNTFLLKSYNRPEFMVEPVKISVDEFSKVFDK